jgi:DNA-binding SARP family transcriptional activator
MHTVQWLLDPSCLVDIVAFESALNAVANRAELEQAMHLYRGELLPQCYEDWILPRREQLRQQAMDALVRLVNLLEEERNYRGALAYCRQLQQIDPYNEETYRRLMTLHGSMGDRAGALRVYQLCVKVLQEELDAAPAPATRELYQRLLDTTTGPPSHTEPDQNQPLLVGRRSEWKRLLDLWFAAGSGRASCVVISGEAGIGKTRLAEELATWVQRQGYSAAIARCYAAEGALTYAPVVAWLRSPALRQRIPSLDPIWRREVARLLPEVLAGQTDLPKAAPLTQGWQRQHLFEALTRAILAVGGPQLLWIDDMQWADRDTLEWLHYLLRYEPSANAQQPVQLLVVATVRREEVDGDHPLESLLAALRQTERLHEIALGPLTAEETAALAAHLAGHTILPAQAGDLHREAEGNPLFVVEMMHARQGREERNGDFSPQDKTLPALPPKLHAVIQARFARLSQHAHELVGLAATIGRAFSLGVLARAWGQDDETLVRSLDEVCQRRIVRERGAEGYDFTHDKLREVAYHSLSAARRRLLHRRVAMALEGEHAQALDEVSGQVAMHYEMAGLVDQAVPFYQRAAEIAQRIYANAEALQFYRRALALQKESGHAEPQQALRLHEQLGDLLHFIGHYAEARVAYLDAARSVPPVDRIDAARLHRKLGNAWREQYHYQTALQLYGEARSLLEETRPKDAGNAEEAAHLPDDQDARAWGQEWVQLLLEMRSVYYWLGQVQEDEALAAIMQPVVERYGTGSQRADFYRTNASAAFRRNRSVATPAMVAGMRQSLAALLAAQDQERIPAAYFMLGFTLLWSGDAEAALAPCHTALHLAEQTGDISLEARALTYLTVALRQCERVDDAQQMAERAKAKAALAQMPEYIATADANLAWVAWRRASWAEVAAFGNVALDCWHKMPPGHASTPFQWTALWPLLALAAHADDLASAISHARALLDPAQQRMPDSLAHLLEQMLRVWDSSAPDRARDILGQSIALAKQLHYL